MGTGQLGYHPLVAVRSDTAEIVGSRLRSGSSQRGNTHFIGGGGEPCQAGRRLWSGHRSDRFWVLVLPSHRQLGSFGSRMVDHHTPISAGQKGL